MGTHSTAVFVTVWRLCVCVRNLCRRVYSGGETKGKMWGGLSFPLSCISGGYIISPNTSMYAMITGAAWGPQLRAGEDQGGDSVIHPFSFPPLFPSPSKIAYSRYLKVEPPGSLFSTHCTHSQADSSVSPRP